tara:strand:+ start:329 stop:1105 length:777 start_codon:yes stop_codon:yes gene_type:complete
MIFYSPQAGTGKTSLAYALSAKVGYTIHAYNASSKRTRGIEFVEEELLPMSRNGQAQQIFLLDEADQLTPAAQSALKGVIENACGIFILTCNDLSKVSTWLQSRCMVHTFNPISEEHMAERLATIAGKEGVEITGKQLGSIMIAHAGDLRAAINALQAFHGAEDKRQFILSIGDSKFDAQGFLSLCFREKAFDHALKMFEGFQPRPTIQQVFHYAVNSTANTNSKLTVIEAAITAERDFVAGVEPNIILANFVRMVGR